MSNSPLVNYTILSPNRNSPRNHKIDTITIHHCSGIISAKNLGDWFAGNGRSSANYGIDSDGKVGLYVPESDRAWTTSSAANDNRAVTIEVSNDINREPWTVSAKAYAKLLDLVTDICKRNDIKKLNFTGDKAGNVTEHCWFANTDCPGTYLKSQMQAIVNEVNKRLGNTPAPAPQPSGLYVVYQAWANSAWLPEVYKADDTNAGYAGLDGIPIRAFRCRISDWEALHFQARRLRGRWFQECDHWGDTGNGYAGNKKEDIDYIMVWSESGKKVAYRVRTDKSGWLPWVYKAKQSDLKNGVAGNAGEAITGIQIKLY